jgi:hypothetical protein
LIKIPFGYKLSEAGTKVPVKERKNYLEAIDEELDFLEELYEKYKIGSLTLQQVSDSLQNKFGHTLTISTLSKRFRAGIRLDYTKESVQANTRTGIKTDLEKPTDYKNPTERKEEKREQFQKVVEDNKQRRKNFKRAQKKTTPKIVSQDEYNLGTASTNEENLPDIIFKPHPGPQTDFLSAPETDVLYGGQAGGGKSFSLVVDPLRYVHRPKHKAIILRKSLKELRELIANTMELYPQAVPGAKWKESDKLWKFPSGAIIEFGYLDKESDVTQYQGQQYSWIGFDEITHLPTEYAWNYLASRLRTTDPEIQCYMRCTTNPGGPGHDWVKKRYIEPSEPNKPFVYGKNPMTGAPLTRKCIPARLSDNPTLYESGDYQAMLETLPDVERKRLLEGDWDVIEGSAFPEFSSAKHVVEPFTIPAHWSRTKAIDYGFSAPSCCLWGAVDPDDGTLVIYRELYEKGLHAEELRDKITKMERPEVRMISGVLDWATWNRTGYTGPTIGEVLTKQPYGHPLRPADKNRVGGKIQVHAHLREQKSGRPGVLIFNTCKNLIREMVGIPLDKNNSEDVDTKVDDHAYDALRYMIMSRPRKESMHEMGMTIKRSVIWTPSDNTFGY